MLPGIKRAYVYVGLGMVVQLVVTGVLYATTPTLQGDWSSYGHVSYAKGQALCRTSLEWIPSAFWQLVWALLYGPYLLFKVRNIHDVHYWRLQVIYSVISGLPGTPLWLAAVFSTSGAFKHVNHWWVPPMWLAPGIIVMQFTTIFFPVYEIIRSQSLMRDTLAIIKIWEDKRGLRDSHSHNMSSRSSSDLVSSASMRELCSMAALEKALTINPDPLLQFAATKDFTAENILFLIQVRHWRQAWASAPQVNETVADGIISDAAKSHLFSSAVQIYWSRVNDKTTDFPINIEHRVRHDWDDIFSPAIPTSKLAPGQDAKHYEAESWIKSPTMATAGDIEKPSNSAETLTSPKAMSFPPEKPEPMFPPHPGVTPLGETRAKMRGGFDEHVFDAAEGSIKYLVLTNTWQKFVKDHRVSFETISG